MVKIIVLCAGTVSLNYEGLVEFPLKDLADGDIATGVRKLYMKGNLLVSLPNAIRQLENLNELYLAANSLTTIPDAIGDLQFLTSLDLSLNRLSSLPSALCRLKKLCHLVLNKNLLTNLPQGFENLTDLTVLNITHNQFARLDLSVCRLPSLRRLQCDQNYLSTLPRQVCQLVKLEACGNRLVSLPLDLGHIPTLRSLYVDSNPYLRWLPVSVSALKKLGTNNCGVQVYEEPYPGLSVRTTTEVTVTLPREVVSITSRRNNVRTLMEISLVAAFRNRKQEGIVFEDLPSDLMNLLLCPTASCLHCSLPIFTCSHPLVFATSDDALLLLGMCCSERCAELAKCRVKHRVVYPRD